MQRSVYHWLLGLLAGWALLSLPSLVALVLPAIQSGKPLTILFPVTGFALLPISVIGLWHLRLWGFICLVLGFLAVLLTHPHAVYLHVACIVVTLVRYRFPKHEENTEHHVADGH